MRYLTVKDVLLLHELAIEKSGGSHGLRDFKLLDSATARPKSTFAGRSLYPNIFSKAAALCHSLIKNHPFIDGNKRTGLLAAMTFLELNNYQILAKQKEIVRFVLKIDQENIGIEEIARWLKSHSHKGS